MKETLLVFDNELSTPASVRALENDLYYQVRVMENSESILRCLNEEQKDSIDLVLLSAQLLGNKMVDVIRGIRASKPSIPVIVLVSYGEDAKGLEALKAGASDFITKPCTMARLNRTMQMVLKIRQMANYTAWLERRAAGHVDFTDIIGEHSLVKQALHIAQQAANSKIPVWIEGERGTQKELFARAIHGAGDRVGKPFVTVNCRMLSAHMAEMHLFGPDMSGAEDQHFFLGKLCEADGGTLFLEDPAFLPKEAQLRLLAFMENGVLETSGEKAGAKVDVRIVCGINTTTGKNSVEMNLDTKLRDRLRSAIITTPPLSYRKNDIPALTEHFIAMYSASAQKYVRGVTPEAMEWLVQQPWPGNVQQLSNMLWRAVMLSSGEWLDVESLVSTAGTSGYVFNNSTTNSASLLDERGKVRTLKSMEEEAIRFALQYTGGCMTRAAKSLGIGRSTLYRKLDEFKIDNYISRANQTTRPMMKVSSMDRS